MARIVALAPGDEEALDAFLRSRAETSMFLRSNMRGAGLVDEGKPMHATYVAARDGDERIVGVAAHCWNGVLLLQAPEPEHLGKLARAAVEATGRPILGLSGPYEQTEVARDALNLRQRATLLDRPEELFSLPLDELQVPAQLSSGEVRCQRSLEEDVPVLRRWRVEFCIETLHHPDTPELHASCDRDVWFFHERGLSWVLSTDDGPVACSNFNAAVPDSVQIGGVWTPRAFRGRGYARCVVAGSLQAAREEGVERAVLFTAEDNVPAQQAYLAIGFKRAGKFGLVLFRD